ncbi:MAG: hypothetical protein H0T79_00635, partial [Deltaproteobacteria bacterium]|nr:hypothetical protein [Deltaproteobacteria bacterium]
FGPKVPGFDLDADSADSATSIGTPPFEDDDMEAEAQAEAARRAALDKPAAKSIIKLEPMKAEVRVVAPEMPAGDVDDEGDLDIGEVSRVVNLADLMRPKKAPVSRDTNGASALAAARSTGSTPNLRTTGAVARIDMATGMPIAPLAPGVDPQTLSPLDPHYIPDRTLAPPVHPTGHRRMYIALAVGALLLIGIVVMVMFVVNQGEDVTSIGLRNGPDYSTERPEDRIRRNGTADPNPNGSATPQNPFLRPTQPVKPRITTNPNPVQELPRDQLSGDEIEAMAKKYEGLTARCFMRAGKGTNAILVGDVKRLVVTLTVAKDGQVSAVSLNEHQNDALGGCLVPMIKSWKFRANGGGLFRITVAAPGN